MLLVRAVPLAQQPTHIAGGPVPRTFQSSGPSHVGCSGVGPTSSQRATSGSIQASRNCSVGSGGGWQLMRYRPRRSTASRPSLSSVKTQKSPRGRPLRTRSAATSGAIAIVSLRVCSQSKNRLARGSPAGAVLWASRTKSLCQAFRSDLPGDAGSLDPGVVDEEVDDGRALSEPIQLRGHPQTFRRAYLGQSLPETSWHGDVVRSCGRLVSSDEIWGDAGSRVRSYSRDVLAHRLLDWQTPRLVEVATPTAAPGQVLNAARCTGRSGPQAGRDVRTARAEAT